MFTLELFWFGRNRPTSDQVTLIFLSRFFSFSVMAKSARLENGTCVSSLVKLLGFGWAEQTYGNQWKVLRHVGTIVSHEGGANYKVRHLEDNLEYIRSKKDLRVHNQAITYHVIDANNRPWVEESENEKRREKKCRESQSDDEENDESESDLDPAEQALEAEADRIAKLTPTTEWTLGPCTVDYRVESGAHNIDMPTLTLPNYQNCSLFDFFLHFIPLDAFDRICTNTSTKLVDFNTHDQYKVPLTRGEAFRYMGLWHKMQVNPRPRRRDYWTPSHRIASDGWPGSGFDSLMARHRFDAITSCFTIGPPATEDNPFEPVDNWLSCLRNQFFSAVHAGSRISADERMIVGDLKDMPAKVFMPRKPDSTGQELKTVNDCVSRIMVTRTCQQKRNRRLEFVPSAGTAMYARIIPIRNQKQYKQTFIAHIPAVEPSFRYADPSNLALHTIYWKVCQPAKLRSAGSNERFFFFF